MPSDIGIILKLDVPIIVRIAERIVRVEDVVKWVPGTIIELQKSADDDLSILVNNVPIGQGTALKVGENFGVRVTFVGDLKDKIAALSGPTVIAEAGPPDVPASDEDTDALAQEMLAGQA